MYLQRLAEAVDILRRTEQTAIHLWGEAHGLALSVQLNLLQALVWSELFLEAEQRAEVLRLKLSLSTASPNSLDRRTALDVDTLLGLILLKTSRLNEAKEVLGLSWRTAADLLGPEHPETLQIMVWLARVFMECGQLEEALGQVNICISTQSRVLGLNHPRTQHARRWRDEMLTRQHSAMEMDL
jgi:hypothetical protein